MSQSQSEAAIISPCVGVCTLDDHDRCEGCYRTAHEITHWALMTPAQRKAIMQQLDQREADACA